MTTNVEGAKNAIPFGSAPKREPLGDFHDGSVVSVTGNTLVMAMLEGREYSVSIAADAYICCDGIICQIDELPIGSRIRLTTKPDNINVATKIESLNNQSDFADLK